jgi:predicted O-methyltransferase YrrM
MLLLSISTCSTQIGTFTGYSALCFAEAGADVVTCELDPRAAAIAQSFFDRR